MLRQDGKEEVLDPGSSQATSAEERVSKRTSSTTRLGSGSHTHLPSSDPLATPQLPQPGQLSLVVASVVQGAAAVVGGGGVAGAGLVNEGEGARVSVTAALSPPQRKALQEQKKVRGGVGPEVSG